ncbi:MAG TPA: GAF domain-containing protein [Anaerolineales bacterium]|nr:GAF domain-containing protein [Anaerolineales bacterium]HNH77564.1 GAF domain-containing protein [Anaerolineales bacterium]
MMNRDTNMERASNSQQVDSVLVRNAYTISIMLLITAIPSVGLFVYYALLKGSAQILTISIIMFIASFGAVAALFLIRRGRSNLAMMIIITSFTITFVAIPFFIKGLGVILAISMFILAVSITGLAMPTRYAASGLIVGLSSGALILLLDYLFLGEARVRVPELERATVFIVVGFALFFGAFTVRHFNRFSLRIKITISILLTGGVIVVTLVWFAASRTGNIINTLTTRYETASRENIQNQLLHTVEDRAAQTNGFFDKLQNDLGILAKYRASLEQQKDIFIDSTYWDADNKVIQLAEGQYGNSPADAASIFIPSTVVVDESLYNDLNTTAYLDFYAPNFLQTHSSVIALYFINTAGATTYYPNIRLAENVPADFDPTKEIFYTIASPENNPSREPRWTDTYEDPAGNGLITTLSIPVYQNDTFLGVIGLDVQLAQIERAIANVKVGDTGYAFLVDKAGHILSMPPEGYLFYNISPEEVTTNSVHELSVLSKGPFDVQEATAQMINGDSEIATIKNGDGNSFFIFSPVTVPNYRLGIVAPENEFTTEFVQSRSEIEDIVQSALQGVAIILIVLLVGAIIVSLWIGQLITRPLVRLTQTAEKISQGDFAARALVETGDETGVLAKAFNSMAEILNSTLLGLEKSILERTRELEEANQSIIRRAGQFEAIARVARTISSTQTLNSLLPQIVDTISQEFGFYHVGIFLVDAHREYAILAAANSEGGKRMLNRNHRLLVGGTGIVGFVTNSGQPRVALDVGMDAAFFNNPDLPDTHSEIALPLLIGTQVIGALDVQSRETDAFSQEDVSILSTLADQVSIAIQNARSYQQSRDALDQAEAASMQMSELQWGRFFAEQPSNGFVFDGLDAKDIKQVKTKDENTYTIPLILRGTKIGTLKLNTDNPNRTWTDDEIAMAQATAERTAFAIENARLLQEAQKRAAKERAIGQITAKIGGLINIESILQTSIQELGNTIPNTDIAIQISPEELEQK